MDPEPKSTFLFRPTTTSVPKRYFRCFSSPSILLTPDRESVSSSSTLVMMDYPSLDSETTITYDSNSSSIHSTTCYIFNDDPDGTLNNFLKDGRPLRRSRNVSPSFQKWLMCLYMNEGQTADDLSSETNWFVFDFDDSTEVFIDSALDSSMCSSRSDSKSFSKIGFFSRPKCTTLF